MTEISDAAVANVTLADFVTLDPSGRVNMIGGALSIIGFDPQRGATAPFGVLAAITCPSPAPDVVAAIELALLDASDQPVALPTPTGETQVMRVAQNVEFREPSVAGLMIPRGAIDIVAHVVLNLGAGIPIAPGHSYRWQVSIDGEPKAVTKFFVPGPVPGPVVG